MESKIIKFPLEQIDEAAKQFLQIAGNNKIVAFYGPMGAGKTTFIKAICDSFGVLDMVNSPTFAIVNEYETAEGDKIFHFDFYRLKSAREAFDIGINEYFDSGCLCLMEWPEIIEEILPDNCLKVTISECSDGTRELSIQETQA